MSYIPARGLSRAETLALASVPGLPPAALAILQAAATPKPPAAVLELGPERGIWFRATVAAFQSLRKSGEDYRWRRGLRLVRVPPAFVTYLDRNSRVKAGELVRIVPAAEHYPGGVYPRGAVDIGPAA